MDKQFNTIMDCNNQIIKNHLVYGEFLLPGLAYIDILFQIAQSNGFDVHKTVLKNISIFNPLVVREDLSIDLTISFKEHNGYCKILVEGIGKGINGEIVQAHKKYMSAELHPNDGVSFDQTIDIEDIKRRAAHIVNIEEAYTQARKNGLVHQDIIKANGNAYLTDEGGLFNLAVPTNYIEDAKDYIFHPTLLDSSTMVATMVLKSLLSGKSDQHVEILYIPIFYEAFFAAELLQAQCYVRVLASSVSVIKDIVYLDIEFFDEKGKQIGILKRLTLKQIRSKDTLISPQATVSNMPKHDVPSVSVTPSLNDQTISNETLKTILTNIFGKYLKMKPHQINLQLGFFELGLESAELLEVITELETILDKTLNPTLLFECNNIEELITYFEQEEFDQANTNKSMTDTFIGSKKVVSESNQESLNKCQETDIAIIALEGRYPEARNIQEFWGNLQDGKDCIVEIPKERWDYSLYFDEDRNKLGKTCSKWGGFIDDVDKFDPLFFNVVPKYAGIMDPQERLFLECAWNLFESIGYTKETLQRLYQGRVGVYVGAMYMQHHFFDADVATESALTISSYGSIANRVSYYFNLQGPSVAVDTMCSSSATAIHMACESIIRGECQAAIAGGVNVSIHPKKYVGLSQVQLLGSHLNCRSFGDGDGYIPGEGVGAVLLKPLSKAIQDKDSIIAVIKSTITNHGGRGNAYAVPNGNAQARLIEDNFKKSGIDPRTISYVEAAANGSALGDPIEFNALTRVFKKYTSDQQFCAIGSVKSNIGHVEAASGIAQLTKVILQLQHRQLVPSIKADPLNPNINFNNTPFYLQRELQEWKRPILMINGEECEFPRRATTCAFGAGGSNAHLIIEEYIPNQEEPVDDRFIETPQIMIFSAKNQERLLAVAEQMLICFERQKELNLADVAYTLQVGREAMDSRLAIVVSNQEELVNVLKEFLKSAKENKEIDDFIPLFTWDLGEADSPIRSFLSGGLGESVVQVLLAERNLEKLAIYWTQGGNIPWEVLYNGQTVRKIYLPNYPFARERYWILTSEVTNHQSTITELFEEEEFKFTIDPHKSTQENIQDYSMQMLAKKLCIAQDQIKLNKNIYDYGMDSIVIMKFMHEFEKQFEIKVTFRDVVEYETLASLSTYLAQKVDSQKNQNKQAVNSKLEEEQQKMGETIDEQVVGALEKLVQGELRLTEVRKLIEGGGKI
ncbi:beta-ketoacyl synthase N-terminal-like domain-containing protein [Pelosinus fermentans]|uniref:6-deoxyerythronolide-B synthase n=1 Tax=Pelosinus fermentans JBW45 TaxID=1192197 RepID=I9DAF9_9FIRM|nr:beta-ketoacyl synthase N-terminal-like domain-containing protein [Pelosinus fermentans]AJQ25408.1 6-deoxyerythronolide-B synthase [Pelosinus fermentans JBW45]